MLTTTLISILIPILQMSHWGPRRLSVLEGTVGSCDLSPAKYTWPVCSVHFTMLRCLIFQIRKLRFRQLATTAEVIQQSGTPAQILSLENQPTCFPCPRLSLHKENRKAVSYIQVKFPRFLCDTFYNFSHSLLTFLGNFFSPFWGRDPSLLRVATCYSGGMDIQVKLLAQEVIWSS